HLSDYRASVGKHLKLTTTCLLLHCFRDPVSRENHYGIIWHFVKLLHKHSATIAQVIHNKFVMHNFMTHINRCLKYLKGPIHNINGSIHTSAKASWVRQTDFHSHTCSSELTQFNNLLFGSVLNFNNFHFKS